MKQAALKHENAIREVLRIFHTSSMTDDEKAESDRQTLLAMGKTVEELDAEIEFGIQNGHSEKTQLLLAKALVKAFQR